MTRRADAHMHLFEGGYRGGSLASRPGVTIDELTLYESLRAEHGVEASLVVGYADHDWCRDNNAYLAGLLPQHPWIHAAAFVPLAAKAAAPDVEKLTRQGFVGLSFYVFGDEAKTALQALPDSLWRHAAAQRWLMSVNARGEDWLAWRPILDHHPDLRLLISHLGLPPKTRHAPQRPERLMEAVLALAAYPETCVKLSGLYAISDPGHDYPHRAAWPYINTLRGAFTARRLLWASDFTPVLDWLTFPQTFDYLPMLPGWGDEELAGVQGGNLLRLLGEVRRP